MATSVSLRLYLEIQSLETVQRDLYKVQIPEVRVTGRGELEYFCEDIHKGNWVEVLFLC